MCVTDKRFYCQFFRTFAIFVFSAAVAVNGRAHEGHEHAPIAIKPAEMYKPTAMPDRIVLTLNGNPRTSVAVTWRTSVDVVKGIAEIAEAKAGPNFSENANRSRQPRQL